MDYLVKVCFVVVDVLGEGLCLEFEVPGLFFLTSWCSCFLLYGARSSDKISCFRPLLSCTW